MPPIHNQFEYNSLRRQLRNHGTTPEAWLWLRLQRRQILGYKFRRQHGIGRYIVDFYCPNLRLVIELDGGHHTKLAEEEYDKERTAYLNSLNIQVLRVWNSDVFNNEEGVIEHIKEVVRERATSLTTPARRATPPKLGGTTKESPPDSGGVPPPHLKVWGRGGGQKLPRLRRGGNSASYCQGGRQPRGRPHLNQSYSLTL